MRIFAGIVFAVTTLHPPVAHGLTLWVTDFISSAEAVAVNEADLGCSAPDSDGVVHCSSGAIVDPVLLPGFQVDATQITFGPGAAIEATVVIRDLGLPEPSVSTWMTLTGFFPDVPGAARARVTASLEVYDANGDGFAAISHVPYDICHCGDETSTYVFVTDESAFLYEVMSIAPPATTSPFGIARTEGELVGEVQEGIWAGPFWLYFMGTVSPGDVATVRWNWTNAAVPEPSTALLLAFGLLSMVGSRRHR